MDNVVLIAEADEDRLESLAGALEGVGLRCLTARTGTEALATVARYKPQLAIVRADLPEVQGTDVCLRIKQEDERKATAVILLTEGKNKEEKFVASEVGADLYLAADQDVEALAERVKELFYEWRLNAAARGLRQDDE